MVLADPQNTRTGNAAAGIRRSSRAVAGRGIPWFLVILELRCLRRCFFRSPCFVNKDVKGAKSESESATPFGTFEIPTNTVVSEERFCRGICVRLYLPAMTVTSCTGLYTRPRRRSERLRSRGAEDCVHLRRFLEEVRLQGLGYTAYPLWTFACCSPTQRCNV